MLVVINASRLYIGQLKRLLANATHKTADVIAFSVDVACRIGKRTIAS